METTRTVIDDYPADKLPSELRRGIDPTHKVRVIVEDRTVGPEKPSPRLRTFAGAAHALQTSVDDAVSRVRRLRDE